MKLARKIPSQAAALSLLLLLLPITSASASVKAGSSCAKKSATQQNQGKLFTCVIVKGKLVWNKGVLIKPTPTSSPTAIAKPTPVPSTSPTQPILAPEDPGQVDFKGTLIYRIVNGNLERKSILGKFFDNDARKESDFSSIRLKAYQELNTANRNTSHPNIEIVWNVRDSFPKEMVEYTKKQIEESAALWNGVFNRKVKVYVTLVTEQDKDFIRSTKPMFSDMVNNVSRFDSKNERPFVTGGGGWFNENNEKFGLIVLGTASYMSTDFMNYEWPEVAAHEFVHVIQQYFLMDAGRVFTSEEQYLKAMPLNFSEGAANTIGYLTGFRNLGWASDAMDWMVWERSKNSASWKKISTESDVLKVLAGTESRSPQEAFEMSYAIGGLANEYFIAKYGFTAFLELLKAMQSEGNYEAALQKSVHISKDQFYNEVAPYILETIKRLSPYN